MVWEFAKEARELSLKFFMGKIMNLGPLAKLDLFGYGKRLKALLSKFDSLIETVMAEHERHDVVSDERRRKDVMDILLDIHHRRNGRGDDANIKLTRNNIKCFLMVCNYTLSCPNNKINGLN